MSAKWMGLVWELRLPPNQRTVLLAMADHADHAGRNISAGMPLIAWKTDYSVREVQRIVAELVETGLVVIVAARNGKPREYALDFDNAERKEPYVRRAPGRPRKTPDSLTGAKDGKRGDKLTGENGKGGDNTPDTGERKTDAEPVEPTLTTTGDPRPNIFQVYEANMGPLSPLIVDNLKDLVSDYGEDWVHDAIAEAVKNNVRRLAYAIAILKRWKQDGRAAPRPAAPAQKAEPPAPSTDSHAERLEVYANEAYDALPEYPPDWYLSGETQAKRQRMWTQAGRRGRARYEAEQRLKGVQS